MPKGCWNSGQFAASAFESSNTPASLSPVNILMMTALAVPLRLPQLVSVSQLEKRVEMGESGENLDLDGKPPGEDNARPKPTATKKDWNVLKIAMNGMRLKNVQQTPSPCAIAGAEFS